MRRLLGFVTFLCIFLDGCGVPGLAASPTPTPTCAAQSKPFVEKARSIVQEWDDATKLTGQTPRSNLPEQISQLQAIRRKVLDLTSLPCTKVAQASLADAMNTTIQGYLDFLAQKSEADVTHSLAVGEQGVVQFQAAIKNLDQEANGTIVALAPTPSPIPAVVPLADVQLGALLITAGDIEGLHRGQASPSRLTYYDKLGVPASVQDYIQQFSGGTRESAFTAISLFDSGKSVSDAYIALSSDVGGNSIGDVGDRATGEHTVYESIKTSITSIVFSRCDAVVSIRAENVATIDLSVLASYAKRVDQEVIRKVCRR